MEQIIPFFKTNGAVIFGALFGVSELLALIPGIKSNSVFQFVFGFLQKEAKK